MIEGRNKMADDILKVDDCSCLVIHQDIIDKVKVNMLKDEILCDLADLFKVFGDSTRIKILHVLSKSEMCVCDISALLGMSQSSVSHQLKTLRQTKLVKHRRDGKVIYYSLADEHVVQIFNQGLTHLIEE
jgi:ArsR family transcriptional regulator, lead/cadmium/zinc/bismuth-responsive transcriptional repressor